MIVNGDVLIKDSTELINKSAFDVKDSVKYATIPERQVKMNVPTNGSAEMQNTMVSQMKTLNIYI